MTASPQRSKVTAGPYRTCAVGYRARPRCRWCSTYTAAAARPSSKKSSAAWTPRRTPTGSSSPIPRRLISDGTGFDWNIPGEPLIGGGGPPSGAANDVAFLTELVGILEQRYCIDTSRVDATGVSGGARTASQLACDASSTFAAVAPVGGLRRPSLPDQPTGPRHRLSRTADPIDPYDGHGQAYWTYSVPKAAQDWASQDGCSSKATTSQPDPASRHQVQRM